jgi:hypothetical protein
MRRTMPFGAVFVLGLCVLGQTARATPETYEFEGYVAGSRVLDPAVPLPSFLACACSNPLFSGTLVVDLALPPAQRLLALRIKGPRDPRGDSEAFEVLPGHPDNRVVSQTTSEVGSNIPLPHWEIVTVAGRTGPRPEQAGRDIGISLQWSGKPGASRQYPPGAQDADLATLTPRTSWRINFTLSDASAVYATAFGNVVLMNHRGTSRADYEATFDDGAAQGWTPRGGQWSAATGDLRNTANTSHTSNTIDGLELPEGFVILADVYLSWGASGNAAGLVFNYRGPGDFYEIWLNSQTARFNQVRGGVRYEGHYGATRYPDAGAGRWHTIYVKRVGFRGVQLEVFINGGLVVNTEFDVFGPPENLPLLGGTVGTFASWNRARFDNVLIGAPIPILLSHMSRFTDFSEFTGESGTWTMANGYLRSSANQAASIALMPPMQPHHTYGISGRIRPEWSGSGNWGGLVYDYIDARNYREVRLSRTVASRLGEIVLAEVIGGVRREVFRAPRSQGSIDPEVFLSLRRENDITIVNELDGLTNIQIRQTPPTTVQVRAGLFAAWNMVRFDDVFWYSVTHQ